MEVNINGIEKVTTEMESTDLRGLSLLVLQVFYFYFVRFMKLVFGSVGIMQSLSYFSH